MKKQFLLLVFSFSLIGCWPEGNDAKFYEYSITNNSGKDLKINSFRNSYPKRNVPIVINLANGQTLKKDFKDTLPPSGYDFTTFFNGDSLIINYNDEKKEIFTFKDQKNRNPFLLSGLKVNYVFSVTDYQNAVDCGGNCN